VSGGIVLKAAFAPKARGATDARPTVGYAFHRMLATTAPGLSVVIGIPVAFVLLSAGLCLGLFILWTRARS
jgi:hypothetical protein